MGGAVLATSCRDDFSEMNMNPSSVNETNPDYLLTQAILKFDPSNYTYWFYNARDMFRLTSLGVSTGGVNSKYNDISGAQMEQIMIDMLTYKHKIDQEIATMKAEGKDASPYAWNAAAADILSIYTGILSTDFSGDVTYTEAGQIWQGGTLTPKFDHVKDLYALWLENLKKDMDVFTTSTNKTSIASTQDMIYGADLGKWAKLANSLRLKIAVRLYNQDPTQAKAIAKEVATATCGYMDELDDGMIFNKAISNTSTQDYVYHFGDAVMGGIAPSQRLMNFLVQNKDPRTRFMYTKNAWNSKIVEAFLKTGKGNQIPAFIRTNIQLSQDGKTFEGWKDGKGNVTKTEPWWVRYYGLPDAFDAANDNANYGDWFNYSDASKSRLNNTYVYLPFSIFQQEMIRGRVDYTLPTAPEINEKGEITGSAPVYQDIDDQPWYGMYMTAGETNYYLAEMKLLGADLPKSAEDYFKQAVTLSVEEYDKAAGLNKIPYYGTNYGYDTDEATIELKDGEISNLLQQTDYQLTGNKELDLEKVYLQEMIHFAMNPMDMFVTARRSGCPKFNSTFFGRTDYTRNGIGADAIPRRAPISALSPTDKMYHIYEEAYKAQGFTIGTTDKKLLNSERVWQDKNAPQWGAGPKF